MQDAALSKKQRKKNKKVAEKEDATPAPAPAPAFHLPAPGQPDPRSNGDTADILSRLKDLVPFFDRIQHKCTQTRTGTYRYLECNLKFK